MQTDAIVPRNSAEADNSSVARELYADYCAVRKCTEDLCSPLSVEDYGVQSMPDVSPPKWHLAHTAWFFETFLLLPYLRGYSVFHPRFHYLFNSYYETAGKLFPRPQRGLLSRPTVDEVYRYRKHVDAAMEELIRTCQSRDVIERTVLGINHEQQHQELLLTDVKHNFSINPLRPAYREAAAVPDVAATKLEWLEFRGGLYSLGHGGVGFAYDNEGPRHKVYLEDFALASRPVTNGEYIEFIEAGGYWRPEYWMSEGWAAVNNRGWNAPLYWEEIDSDWWVMTLSGMQKLDRSAPVCHVSFYEADAYARWAGKRLPGEAEWELVATGCAVNGNMLESDYLEPVPAPNGSAAPSQVFGDVWEWTRSAYGPYPGYRAPEGPIGEYNGKFMSNQMVLRGGSCATPRSHIRATYRNFFYPVDRWQFSGIRLADDR